MTDRPILFSGAMVRALIAGKKTQTRRMLRLQPDDLIEGQIPRQLRISVGDRLWVREAFSIDSRDVGCFSDYPLWYWADGNPSDGDWTKPKPSIHMWRWASRIRLTITAVKVERLQEISEEDAQAEDASFHDGRGIGHSIWRHDLKDVHANARSSFVRLWTEINGEGAWDANPFVAAYSFSAEQRNIDG